jgi:hypothetical protein
MLINNNPNIIVTKINRKMPLGIMLFFFLFIYILQYPISLFITNEPELRFNFTIPLLLKSYLFVFFSLIILFTFFFFGTLNSTKKVSRIIKKKFIIKINHNKTFFILFFFYLWSFLMLKLKVGMTFYTDFQPLPFRLTGILFYGRLIIQPIVLSLFSFYYATSKSRSIYFSIIFFLGLIVAITSGSRFASIMFAMPLLLLFNGKTKFIIFGSAIFLYILTATLSRHFFLPYQIGGNYIEIYANEIYQDNISKDLILLPFQYVIFRIMGISEVMMTLSYHYPSSIINGFYSLISYFIPLLKNDIVVSAKTIYGLSDDEFGGFGLDTFSNYWLYFGRNLITYILGLSFISWLFGRVYVFVSIFLQKISFKEGELVVFVLLFILFMDGRASMFPIFLFISWILYKFRLSFII